MSNTPDLGPVPQRITVAAPQVRRLIEEQFPQWAGLPVQPVASGGWDNWTFHLGAGMLVRLPSAAEYALAVDKEHRWLPVLAPQLPLPIPVPLAKGEPGAGYPYSWSVYPWLDGEPASADRIANPVRFAADLAGFLAALRGANPADGPRPGKHNWFRGGTLRTYDGAAQSALTALDGHIDVDLARRIWQTALDARGEGAESWFHGDVAEGNLLLSDGQLAAVIDFGTCGVGDPACDLAIAWTLLTAEGRQVFRERLSAGQAEWSRGRGWALWKTLVAYAHTLDGDDEEEAAGARRALDEIFSERRGSTGLCAGLDVIHRLADRRFDHDVIIWGDPSRWPPVGTRVHGRIQGTMPSGQIRVAWIASQLVWTLRRYAVCAVASSGPWSISSEGRRVRPGTVFRRAEDGDLATADPERVAILVFSIRVIQRRGQRARITRPEAPPRRRRRQVPARCRQECCSPAR